MGFTGTLAQAAVNALPAVIVPLVVMIPYIPAGQLWPAVRRPRAREYGFNIAIALIATSLPLPAGATRLGYPEAPLALVVEETIADFCSHYQCRHHVGTGSAQMLEGNLL